jgi:hypothetical protein
MRVITNFFISSHPRVQIDLGVLVCLITDHDDIEALRIYLFYLIDCIIVIKLSIACSNLVCDPVLNILPILHGLSKKDLLGTS